VSFKLSAAFACHCQLIPTLEYHSPTVTNLYDLIHKNRSFSVTFFFFLFYRDRARDKVYKVMWAEELFTIKKGVSGKLAYAQDWESSGEGSIPGRDGMKDSFLRHKTSVILHTLSQQRLFCLNRACAIIRCLHMLKILCWPFSKRRLNDCHGDTETHRKCKL